MESDLAHSPCQDPTGSAPDGNDEALRRLRIRQTRPADWPRRSGTPTSSALASLANRPVSLRVYPERCRRHRRADHPQASTRLRPLSYRESATIQDWGRYLADLQRKTGALRKTTPFAKLPPAFRTLPSVGARRKLAASWSPPSAQRPQTKDSSIRLYQPSQEEVDSDKSVAIP